MILLALVVVVAAADPVLLPPPDPVRAAEVARDRPFATTRDCVDLRIMTLLGSMSGAAGLDEVTALKNVACSVGLAEQPVKYQSGERAKTAAGTWTWPNGKSASTSTGAWSWPDGSSARGAGGSWRWPDGSTAFAAASGRITLPGALMPARNQDVINRACGASPKVCSDLPLLRALDPALAEASLLSVAR